MAYTDIKISEFPTVVGNLTGNEFFPVLQGGVNKKAALSQISIGPLGLGTMALQNSDTVNITGGTVLSSVISGPIDSASNISGGAANQIIYQVSSGATGFIDAPSLSNTYLQWNGTGYQWAAVTSGGVTSVDLTPGTGISVSGGPITSSGSITVTNTAPDQTVVLTQGGTTTITGTYPNFTISSADQYAGTVTSVAALTLGTTGTDLSSTVATGTTTPVITLNVPTASATNRGALSSADWSTFNGKQAALVSGTNIKTVGGATLLGSGDVGTIGLLYGGTGATTASAARTNLGATTVGANVFTLTNPSAITFPRFNADNTVSALDAATFRTAIGAGTSSTTGTVTTVSVVSANGFAGTVATATTTPAITISTSITGLLKGNATAISAASAGTDYVAPSAYASANGLTMATARLLGRTTALSGAAEEISVAGGLTLSAGVLTGASGTVTSVAALTLGTTGTDLSSTVATGTTTPVITLNVPTASAANRGALSSTDWSTFNGKQAALVSGTNIKTVGGATLLGSGDVGTIGIAYGGTGQTTAATARVALLPSLATNAGKVLAVNVGATDVEWISVGGSGTVTSVDVSGGTTGLTTSGGPITGSGTITLAGTLAVLNGGTGSTTAAGARTNLGATTVGGNFFTLTNPSAITFPRINADNTVSTLDAATFRTAIGAGTSSTTGTVTTVSVVSANGFAGTVATATSTPAITISTSVTGVLKGNGTAISAAAAATDYVAPSAYASANGLTMATARLLGRTTALSGAAEEISVAGGLTLSAGVLTGASGTVTSVAALTLGTTGTDLSSTVATGTTTPVITLNVPTASAANRGALSSTDWSTFNGKQAALVSGTNIKTVNGTSLLGSGDVGTIDIAHGGTGQTTAATARVALLPSLATNAGKVLAVNTGATDVEWITVGGTGTVTSVSGTGTVNGLTLTGTVTTSGSLTLGGTLNLASPPAIGGTTPAAGAFTSVYAPVLNTGYTTTATAAGTTTLTASSTSIQYFTGTTTQTIVMPVTSTLQLGWSYHIANTSTGTLIVNSSGGNAITAIPAGLSVMMTCILTSGTTAASWDYGFTDFPGVTGTGSAVLATGATLNSVSMSGVRLSSSGAAIGPAIADFFPSTLSLDADSSYEIEAVAYFLKTTAGTVVWTWAFSSASNVARSIYDTTPLTGVTATVTTAAPIFAQAAILNSTTVAHAASGSLTTGVRHMVRFRMTVFTNLATTLNLRATSSAGTVTPNGGSYMRLTKVV